MKIMVRIFIVGVIIYFLGISLVFADLTINLVAVNGSEEVKEMDIKSYLPKELTAADVVETGSLAVEYDVGKAAYFVSGKVKFEPKESKTFQIKVKDVWQVSTAEVGILKQQVDQNLKLLEKKPNYEIAKIARDKLVERMDYIFGQQQNYSQDIERRIEQSRAYSEELQKIRNNIFSLQYLSSEISAADMESDKTIKFIIEVKNPNEKEEKTIEQKHSLPKEVRLEDVIDAKGFDVRFDEKKNSAFLTKKETFAPGETKKYEIIIKDIWSFPLVKVESIQARAQTAYDEINDLEYSPSVQFLFDEITSKVGDITQSQATSENLSINEHIGVFRTNTKRFSDSEDLLKKLENLLAIVHSKRLEELESKQVRNVLQRLKVLRGLATLSEVLFKKKKFSLTTVWRIILGILGFVAFFTTINFFIWVRRSGELGEERRGKEPIKEVPKPRAAGGAAPH